MTAVDPRRRRIMQAVGSSDTKPEAAVRLALRALGRRYRLHVRSLPGRPDIVIGRLRTVIFVHGCFWHLHEGCPKGRLPKSRLDYWKPKLLGNKTRDAAVQSALEELGWRVLVVWQCETRDRLNLQERLRAILAAAETPGQETRLVSGAGAAPGALRRSM